MKSDNEALVSVIIPCHNYGHFLYETIQSLQSQSHTNWECLIIDNNSTDNSVEIIQALVQSDERVKYLSESIIGPSAARNKGLHAAQGEYIQFLDADDLLESEKIKNALNLFKYDSNIDIVYSDMRYFHSDNPKKLFFSMDLNDSSDKPWMPYVKGRKNEILAALLKENIMVISSPLIKKKCLDTVGFFDPKLAYNEDWELWLRLAFANYQFTYDASQDTKSLIRVHHTSHSKNLFNMYFSGLQVELKYLELIENTDLKTSFKKKMDNSIYYLEYLLFKNRKDQAFLNQYLPKLAALLPTKKKCVWLKLANDHKFALLSKLLIINIRKKQLKYKLFNV
jgi:glycosyltransferase involved in cell wall biosynthesis